MKLRYMIKATKDVDADENWRNSECEKHGDEMIEILRDACGLSQNDATAPSGTESQAKETQFVQ